jgi:sugar lactone lactonase YvrE
MMKVECVSSLPRFDLGEGARWINDRLVWVDLLVGELWQWDPVSDAYERLLKLDQPIGAVTPTTDDRWLMACGPGIAMVDGSVLKWIHRPEADSAIPMRMNDACTDRKGCFLVGSMAYDATPGAGSLYRLELDGSLTTLITGLACPNGPAFSIDGSRMFLADSGAGRIDVYEYTSGTGEIGARKTFAQLSASEGVPDGMTVDADDHLWSAIWGGAQLRRYDPEGMLVTTVHLPVAQPTSCVFGGKFLTELYITSATHGLGRTGDSDGRVLVCSDSGASGVPSHEFPVAIDGISDWM